MRIIRNYDVSSYYPHLMTICGYTSRNIPDAKIFSDVLERRMKAKAEGDKATANALKLVVNTTYGAMLNQYNALYDPLMGRSVCISGQLYLLELCEHLYQDIEGLKLIQCNTDGIMIEFDDSHYEEVQAIVEEWQRRTGFELEEDSIKSIAQKDVNNYVEVQCDGAVKSKGGYLVKGIAKAGAFKINNDAVIVATAIQEYFVNGIPVEKTINDCDDIRQFQIIAKAGGKYKESFHLIDGEKVKVQKVNRVYATKDERYGKLYKVKAENNSVAQIASLPEHCIVDNTNELTIDDVDKSFYIDMAQKRVNDFKGKTRRQKMAGTTTKKNVYQKLIAARQAFLKAGAKQSGKNMKLEFKYFELSDIVPTVTDIFAKEGLIALDRFEPETAIMTIVNVEDPIQKIEFVAPFNQIDPLISNAGKQVTNTMQALGSSITYMRRYLYQIAMDICVADDIEPTIDNSTNNRTQAVSATHKSAPATAEQRQEVKEEITAPNDNATDLQIKSLKNVLKKWKKADPSKEEAIAEIAVNTNGFTTISKADCEALIQGITAKLEGGQE